MLQGYSIPLTPNGTSSLAPHPPWHYAGECLAVEFAADSDALAGRCTVFFKLASPIRPI